MQNADEVYTLAVEIIAENAIKSSKEVEKCLKSVDKVIDNINKKRIKVDSDISSLQASKKEIEEIQKKIEALQSKKLSLFTNKSLDNNAVQKQIKDIDNEISKLQAKTVKLSVVDKDLQDAQSNAKKLNTDMSKLNEVKPNLQVKYDSVKRAEDTITSLMNKSKELRSFGSNLMTLGNQLSTLVTNNGNNFIGRISDFLTKTVLFNGASQVVNASINQLTDGLSQAVTRYDQLNVSRRTMDALGVSTQQTAKAQQELSDSIEGLPTKLNDALSMVTKFTSINHDVERSSKLFEAINNGVLAFGGSSEDVNNVVEQYSQIMGSKMDARTLLSFENSNFTPVLTAVAKKMGMTFAEFREKFTGPSPTISLKQFEDALIELNENGGGGLKKLSDMAKQTSQTIGNGLNLIKIRIGKSGADFIAMIDKMVKKATGLNIYQNIYDFTEVMMKKIQDFSKYVASHQDDILNFISELKGEFSEFGNMFGKFDADKLFKGIGDIIKESLTFVKDFIGVIDKTFGPLLSLVGNGDKILGFLKIILRFKEVGLVFGFVGKQIKLFGTLFGAYGKIYKYATGFSSSIKGLNLYANTIGKLTSMFGGLNAKIKEYIAQSTIVQKIKNLSPFKKMVDTSTNTTTVEAPKPVETLKNSSINMRNAQAKMYNNFGTASMMLASSGSMVLLAKGLKEFNDATQGMNFAEISGRIAGLGIAVTAIGQLNNLLSTLANSAWRVNWKNQLASAVSMFASGGSVWLLAKSLQEVAKIDLNGIWDKLKTLGEVFVAVQGMTTAWGMIGAGVTPVLIGNLIGLGDLFATGGAIYSMAKGLSELNKMPLKIDNVQKKLKMMMEVADTLNTGGHFKQALDGLFAKADYSAKGTQLEFIIKFAESLESIKDIDIDKDIKKSLKEKLSNIKDILSEFNGKEFFGKDEDNVINAENRGNTKTLGELISSMVKVATSLKELDGLQLSSQNIAQYKQKLLSLRDILSVLTFRTEDGEKDTSSFNYIAKKIGSTSDSYQGISTAVQGLITSVDNINQLNEKLKGVSNLDSFNANIEILQKALQPLMSSGKDDKGMAGTAKNISKQKYTKLKEQVEAVKETISSLSEVAGTQFDTNLMVSQLNDLNTAIETINGFGTKKVKSINKVDFGGLSDRIGSIKEALASLSEIANTQFNIGDESQGFIAQMNSIRTAMDKINELVGAKFNTTDKDGNTVEKGLINSVNKGNFGKMQQQVSFIQQTLTDLVTVSTTQFDVNAFGQKIDAIRDCLNKIKGLSEEFKPTDGNDNPFQSFTDTIKNLVSQLTTLSADFIQTGESLGTSLMTGFTDDSVKETLNNGMLLLVTSVGTNQSVISAFKNVGKTLGDNMCKGLTSDGGFTHTKVRSAITNALGTFPRLGHACGVSIGNNIASGVQSALDSSNISFTVKAKVHKSGGGVVSNSGRKGNKSSSGAGYNLANLFDKALKTLFKAKGGPVYRADGGVLTAFVPRGTDTIPAMLTQGEYVIRKSSVNKYGTDFLDVINSGKLENWFYTLTRQYANGNNVSKVYNINNNNTINNYDNRQVSINSKTAHGGDGYVKAKRFMGAIAV